MPDYLNKNGETYTEQELIGYAEEENLTLEEYMSTKTFEVVDPGKTTDFSTRTQATESNVMGSESDDGSLVYEYRTEGNEAAWGRSKNGEEMEVVDATKIPEDWFDDPKFKQVYEQQDKPQKLKDAETEKAVREV